MGNQDLNIKDAHQMSVSPQLFQNNLKLQYHANAKNYFENELRWFHEKTDAHASIVRNEMDALSTATHSETSWLSNSFTWTHRLNQGLLMHASLINSFHQSPQQMQVHNIDQELSENFHQLSEFRKTLHQADVTFMGRKNRLQFVTSTGLRLSHTPYESDLMMNSNASISSNEVDYHYNQFYHNSQFTYAIKTWRFTPRLNLRLLSQNIDFQESASMDANNFVIEPSLQILRNLGMFSLFSLNASYRQTPVIADEIFMNPVMTSHRNHISNMPSLDLQNSFQFTAALFGNQLTSGTEYGVALGIQNHQGAFFNRLEIDENNIFIQQYYEPKSFTQYTFNTKYAKFIKHWNFRIQWQGGFNHQNVYNAINDQHLTQSSLNYFSNELNFRSIWSGSFNIAASARHTLMTNKSELHDFENQTFSLSKKMIFRPNKNLHFSLDLDYQMPTFNASQQTFLFSDFEFSYKPKSRDYSFGFLLRNLLNENRLINHSINEYSSSVFVSDILPRHFLISFGLAL